MGKFTRQINRGYNEDGKTSLRAGCAELRGLVRADEFARTLRGIGGGYAGCTTQDLRDADQELRNGDHDVNEIAPELSPEWHHVATRNGKYTEMQYIDARVLRSLSARRVLKGEIAHRKTHAAKMRERARVAAERAAGPR